MYKPLEKARKDPDSMKARVLSAARKLFGQYGYHGTTTRMIAKEVGIDISTLYYHWGEKKDLFESVVVDVRDDYRAMIKNLEGMTEGKSSHERYDVAIDHICDFLINHPEVPNLMAFQTFSKTKQKFDNDLKTMVTLREVADAMGFFKGAKNIPIKARFGMLAVWFSILCFVAGEKNIRPQFEIDRDQYAEMIKDTMKRLLIANFDGKKTQDT